MRPSSSLINIDRAFVLFAHCDVLYDGRAASTLETGNYLIVYKDDGSIQIQAGNKTVPRNYQGSGAKLEMRGHVLISRRKAETLNIILHKVHYILYPQHWSCAEIDIIRTEKELVNKLFRDWTQYIDGEFEIIKTEFQTPLGPVDLAGMEANGHHHLVEVKRKNISIQNISQLNRYVTAVRDLGFMVTGYIAAPEIGTRARQYCESLDFRYLCLRF